MKKYNYDEKRDIKLLSKQRILFRSFIINTIFVLLIWLLTFIPEILYIGVLLTGVSAPMFFVYAVGSLALWGIGGIMFFLVPAIAILWERKRLK